MGEGTACAAEEMTMLEKTKKGVATNAQLQTLEEKMMMLGVRMTALQREIRLNRWLLVFLMAWLTFLRFLP